jgi:hypothetical protein
LAGRETLLLKEGCKNENSSRYFSGGSGTRLWPMSRAGFPKQMQRLHGKETLFVKTDGAAVAFAERGNS